LGGKEAEALIVPQGGAVDVEEVDGGGEQQNGDLRETGPLITIWCVTA